MITYVPLEVIPPLLICQLRAYLPLLLCQPDQVPQLLGRSAVIHEAAEQREPLSLLSKAIDVQ